MVPEDFLMLTYKLTDALRANGVLAFDEDFGDACCDEHQNWTIDIGLPSHYWHVQVVARAWSTVQGYDDFNSVEGLSFAEVLTDVAGEHLELDEELLDVADRELFKSYMAQPVDWKKVTAALPEIIFDFPEGNEDLRIAAKRSDPRAEEFPDGAEVYGADGVKATRPLTLKRCRKIAASVTATL